MPYGNIPPPWAGGSEGSRVRIIDGSYGGFTGTFLRIVGRGKLSLVSIDEDTRPGSSSQRHLVLHNGLGTGVTSSALPRLPHDRRTTHNTLANSRTVVFLLNELVFLINQLIGYVSYVALRTSCTVALQKHCKIMQNYEMYQGYTTLTGSQDKILGATGYSCSQKHTQTLIFVSR
jgi:hypothetical protein